MAIPKYSTTSSPRYLLHVTALINTLNHPFVQIFFSYLQL